jgi:MraZ protein
VTLFRGTFDHSLDAKNRLTMPARYRGALSDGMVLAIPFDQKPCVGVWRAQEYDDYIHSALAGLQPLSPRRAELERFFYGSSHDTELDSAGRIMVPARLSEHAQLGKEVLIVGVGDRLELWSKPAWQGHQPQLSSAVAEITARVDDTA